MILHDFFYDGKTDARPCIYFFAVQFLEHTENTLAEMGFETDAVVFDCDMAIFFFRWKFLVI